MLLPSIMSMLTEHRHRTPYSYYAYSEWSPRPQRVQRIDLCCPPCRDEACERNRRDQERRHGRESEAIGWADAEQHGCHQPLPITAPSTAARPKCEVKSPLSGCSNRQLNVAKVCWGPASVRFAPEYSAGVKPESYPANIEQGTSFPVLDRHHPTRPDTALSSPALGCPLLGTRCSATERTASFRRTTRLNSRHYHHLMSGSTWSLLCSTTPRT